MYENASKKIKVFLSSSYFTTLVKASGHLQIQLEQEQPKREQHYS